jgi:amidase
MGVVRIASGVDLPAGLSFVGPAWGEARMLGLGYAYEQLRGPAPTPRYVRHSTK